MSPFALLAALASLGVSGPEPTTPSVAFHYGAEPPLEALAVFDWAVVDPAGARDERALRRLAPAVPIAYVAVGETAAGASWADRVRPEWVLGVNAAWGGRVMDLASPGWTRFLLEEVLPELWGRGFRGFFLDALDSHVAVLEPADRPARWEALSRFVVALRERFPEAVIVANRGFEVLDEVGTALSAVAAESLFEGWDPVRRIYRPVPEDDRAWLARELLRARSRGLTTIVVDYLPPNRRVEARATARRIADAGHVPWVAPAELDALGVGLVEVLPRDVLLLYDGAAEGDVAFSAAHRFLALPLEHVGLVPRYVDVRGPLPRRRLAGEVAGVVSWLGRAPLDRPAAYREFLLRQLEEGVPIAVFGTLGEEANEELLASLGLRRSATTSRAPVRITKAAPIVGFEVPPLAVAQDMVALRGDGPGFEPLLELSSGADSHQPISLAPWGGYALQPHALVDAPGGEGRWVIDPFVFLARALRLPPAPIVDPTTENGRRLLVAHVDGDGAASRAELPGRPYALTVVRRLLERRRFAHTVSVVEGEIGPEGLESERSAELEAEARRIFALPHVEAASHGYSHPFEWGAFEAGRPAHLPVPGGTPSIEREIAGSLAYVSGLAGRRVELFLWSGDALPGRRSLAVLEALGAAGMNGGFTIATDERPSVTHVAPRGRPVGEGFQVYAPILNDNVFTGAWTGPFWGYRRVRETFERTERPRRLVPIGIYYHFFSATRVAGLRALEQVYDDALAREPLPVPASTWVRKVLESRRAVVALGLDGVFHVDRVGEVRTLRLPPELSDLDLDPSVGVLGVRRTEAGTYAHLDGRRRVGLVSRVGPGRPGVGLVEASARLAMARREPQRLELTFAGPPPIAVTVAGGRCGSGGAEVEEGLRYLLRSTTRLTCFGGKRR